MTRSVSMVICAVLLAGCSAFGVRSGTEQPAYEVVERIGDDVEIRRYGERLAAEVTVEAEDEMAARNEAFRILADYIFGANRAAEEIAMTATRRGRAALGGDRHDGARGDHRVGRWPHFDAVFPAVILQPRHGTTAHG